MPTIVAVSRQFGSGGARIGRTVAQRLGYRYADREILAEAARRLNVEEGLLEPFEERTASVWDRIGMLFALGAPDTPFVPPSLPSVSESRLFDVQCQVIASIAAHGDAVIVGRGASYVLRDTPGLVSVFLHAPLAARVALAMSEYQIGDAAAATEVVRESDRARSRFLRTVTGRDWCDATLYDLAMDTSVCGLDCAADLIVSLVKMRAPAGERAASQA